MQRLLWLSLLVLATQTSAGLAQSGPRAVPGVLYTPAGSVELAHADALRLAPSQRITTRYLSCYAATSPEELDDLYRLASLTVHSLSFTKRFLAPPERVDAEGRLLRVDLYALGIDPKTWDRLGRDGSGPAPLGDRYFHRELESAQAVQAQTTEAFERSYWPGGTWQGAYYKPGYYDTRVSKTATIADSKKASIVAQADWLPKRLLVGDGPLPGLVQMLESESPVLRCEWFIVNALQPPAYIAFQGGPKTQEDLERLAGKDEKAAERAGVQLRGVALFSEVANRNRALERTPLLSNYGRGAIWESFDYLNSIRKNDLAKNLLLRRRDAGEIIWSLPNGLQGYGLVNGAGAVIEFADPRIAVDNRTLLHDKVVYTGYKCMFCHANGIIPIADEVRLSSRDFLGFLVPDRKQRDRVADLYFGEDINRLVFADQVHYAAAVKAVTGKDPAAMSLALQELYRRYQDEPVTIEAVAIETGYPLSAVRPVIEEAGRVGSLSHTFVRLLRDRKARRDQFEEAFPEIMSILALVKEKK